MRRAAKVDANHRTIVAAFKALGCTVQSLAAVGKGVPDLLVAFANLNHLVEIKDGRKVKSARKQTPAQVVWASTWRAPRHLVESVEDVQRLVNAWKTQVEALHSSHNCVIAGCTSTTPKRSLDELCAALQASGARLLVVPSDVEVDASDWERPRSEGLTRNPLDALNKTRGVVPSDDVLDEPWLPMPHKDSPSLSLPADCGPFCSCTACVAAGGGR